MKEVVPYSRLHLIYLTSKSSEWSLCVCVLWLGAGRILGTHTRDNLRGGSLCAFACNGGVVDGV